MKHTRDRPARKPVTLAAAMERVDGLTQLKLEELSGVDRTRISKLCTADDPRVLHDTYQKLDAALRRLRALRPGEQLVFGSSPETVSAP